MSLASSLRRWLRRSRTLTHRLPGARPGVEPLEDRCVPDAGTAAASGISVFRPDTGAWYLHNTPAEGAPDVTPFAYGGASWTPVAGDWTGSGHTSIGVFDPGTATWYLKNSDAPGAPDIRPFRYGEPGWIPVVGDWMGTGHTGIGVFDPATATFYLRTEVGPGAPDAGQFRYGAAGWLPVVGDWDGNGTTSAGVFDPATATFYLRNENGAGAPDAGQFRYGAPGWVPVAGDWNGDGTTSVGVVDPGWETWYLRNSNSAGAPDIAPFAYGARGWTPLALNGAAHRFGGVLPIHIEPNVGQTDPQVPYLTRASHSVVFFTPDGVTVASRGVIASGTAAQSTTDEAAGGTGSDQTNSGGTTVEQVERIRFVGANPAPVLSPEQPQASYTNYFLGNDPAQWHTGVPNYGQLRYQSVWPGVDAVFHGNQGNLEYDFVVSPGADPGAIQVAFPDTTSVEVAPDGHLVLHTSLGDITQSAPTFFQVTPGGRTVLVHGGYQLRGPNTVGFTVSGYNPGWQLIIDPIFSGATYLGGTGDDGLGGSNSNYGSNPMAVDSAGNVYLTGGTTSTDFPGTTTSVQPGSNGKNDVLVAVMNAQGTGLAWATYLGGTDDDIGLSIALDPGGGVYVTGQTKSTNFPTTGGSLQKTNKGGLDAFVTKIRGDGKALQYSTYLGGSKDDIGRSIAVDATGNAYVTGDANSNDFPTTGGSFLSSNTNGASGFLTKLNSNGSKEVYSTYIGGFFGAHPRAVVVDGNGQAYVTGDTLSSDMAMTTGTFQPKYGGGLSDGFLYKFNSTGKSLVFGTYLGGGSSDFMSAVALDPSGDIYLTGYVDQFFGGYPVTPGAYQTTAGKGHDALVIKLTPNAGKVIYATYLAGGKDDDGWGITADWQGNAYVVGSTASTDFPVSADGLQTVNGGQTDAFLVKLNAAGNGELYGTYIGGNGNDLAYAVAGGPNFLYVAGTTDSTTGFPVVPGAFQSANAGKTDLWVSAVSNILPPPPPPSPPPPPPPPPPISGGGGGGGGGGGVAGGSPFGGPGPDVFEPNDTSDVASGMGPLSGLQGFAGLSIDRHANGLFDQDWYKWSMSTSGTFNVNLTNINAGGGDIHVRVFQLNDDNTLTELGNGTQIGGFTSQGTSVPVQAGQEIYVWVYGFNFAVGTYNMTVSLV